MVYKWKLPGVMAVDAQTAGEEMERIYQKNGKLEPAALVDESRPADAPLHPCFEWDDSVAAEKYREGQAATMIRAIVVEHEANDQEPVLVRGFFRTAENYEPLRVVVNSEEKMEYVLAQAKRELRAFSAKYSMLSELGPVFEAIEAVGA